MKSSIFRTKSSTTCRALLLLSFCQLAISANILYFFPGGNVSHKTAVWPWVLEMAKRGHNVTFISPHPKTPVAHPNIVDHAVEVLQDEVGKVYQVDRFQDREEGKELVFDYNQMSIDTCQAVVNSIGRDPVITSIFQNGSSYDLVVINTIFGECGHFVGHYLKAKTITYDSCTMLGWYYDTYGVSPEAGWVPDLLSKYETFPMSFWDRVRATYYTMYWGIERYRLSPLLQNVVQPLFGNKELPHLYQLENDVSLVFINSHPSIDFARTLPPLFIDIGGMASTSSLKPLPKVKLIFYIVFLNGISHINQCITLITVEFPRVYGQVGKRRRCLDQFWLNCSPKHSFNSAPKDVLSSFQFLSKCEVYNAVEWTSSRIFGKDSRKLNGI